MQRIEKFGLAVVSIGVMAYFGWFDLLHREQIFDAAKQMFASNIDGVILVDSPEVYTRERLVNDRYQQDAWLAAQLKQTDSQVNISAIQGSILTDQRRTLTMAGTIGFKSLIPSVPEQIYSTNERATPEAQAYKDGNAAREALKDAPRGTQDFVPRPQIRAVDAFVDKLEFRNKIRDEMLENQLDDRHDLQGSTIVRMKFDATILPGTRKDSLVAVLVKIHPPQDQCNDSKIKVTRLRTSDDREVCVTERDFELYREWRERQEKILAQHVDTNSNDYMLSSLSPRLAADILDKLKTTIEDRELAAQGVDKFLLDGYRKYVAESFSYSIDQDLSPDQLGALVRAIEALPFEVLNSIIAECLKRAAVHAKSQNPNAGIPATRNFEIPFPWLAISNSAKSLDHGSNLFSVSHTLESNSLRVIDCPVSLDNQSTKIRLLAKALSVLDSPRIFSSGANDVDMMRQLLAERFQQLWQTELNHYAWFETKGCKVNNCRIVSQEISKQVIERYLHDHSEVSSAEFLEKFSDDISKLNPIGRPHEYYLRVKRLAEYLGNFVQRLNEKQNLYSYAVTPKQSVERIAEGIRSERRALRFLSLAGQAQNINADTALQLADVAQNVAERFRSQPLVVGFGEAAIDGFAGAQPPPNPTGLKKAAAFGWIVGPSLAGGADGDADSRQQMQQLSLTAIVSLPGWWKAASVDIVTCWIPKSDTRDAFQKCRARLHEDEGDAALKGCSARLWDRANCIQRANEARARFNFPIMLPGDPDSVSRALNFLEPRTPFVNLETSDPGTPIGKFVVGQPGSILLKGGRLWRSAAVSVGAQLSDEIVVLPNMLGILAKFHCIEAPTTFYDPEAPKDTDRTYRARVSVWTSEGEAPSHFASIVDPRKDKQLELPACLQGKPFAEIEYMRKLGLDRLSTSLR